jgi:hypothetical protein
MTLVYPHKWYVSEEKIPWEGLQEDQSMFFRGMLKLFSTH